jgi:hypothetical protein
VVEGPTILVDHNHHNHGLSCPLQLSLACSLLAVAASALCRCDLSCAALRLLDGCLGHTEYRTRPTFVMYCHSRQQRCMRSRQLGARACIPHAMPYGTRTSAGPEANLRNVIEVIDHHADAGQHETLPPSRKNIQPTISCATLVAEELNAPGTALPRAMDARQLRTMLLGVILLDSHGLSEAEPLHAQDFSTVDALARQVAPALPYSTPRQHCDKHAVCAPVHGGSDTLYLML